MLRFLLFFFFLILTITLSACAKKQPIQTQNLKEQIQSGTPSIPFATTKAQSNQWYQTHFSPILKQSKNVKNAHEYEKFAKLYFADLSQMPIANKFVDSEKLLQSVFFTEFSQEMLQEFLFLQTQNLEIAPWELFQSTLQLHDNITSASFVVQIAENVKGLENESYENLNKIVLANNLLELTQLYTQQTKTSPKTKEITETDSYILPPLLQSLLFYKILYAKYFEKFQSNFILYSLSKQSPMPMLHATNKVFRINPPYRNVQTMQQQFQLQSFDASSLVSIAQCKAGKNIYPSMNACIRDIFIPWIAYLQKTLRKQEKAYFFPIFTESKLCLVVQENAIILYPNNKGAFCITLYNAWQKYNNR